MNDKLFKIHAILELPDLACFYLYFFRATFPLNIAYSILLLTTLYPKGQTWNEPFQDKILMYPAIGEILSFSKVWVFFPTCTPQGNSKSIISAITHISSIKYLMHRSRNGNLIALKSVCHRRSWQAALLSETTNWHHLYSQLNKSNSQVQGIALNWHGKVINYFIMKKKKKSIKITNILQPLAVFWMMWLLPTHQIFGAIFVKLEATFMAANAHRALDLQMGNTYLYKMHWIEHRSPMQKWQMVLWAPSLHFSHSASLASPVPWSPWAERNISHIPLDVRISYGQGSCFFWVKKGEV